MSMVSREPFQFIGRYADGNRWEVLNGPGDGRVTGEQVLEDEGVKGKWTEKVVLVTGVYAGIGVKTFEAMAATGATVFGTARNLDKARDDALGPLLDNGRGHVLHMDHTDLASVRACANAFRQQSGGKLNVLICNAAARAWFRGSKNNHQTNGQHAIPPTAGHEHAPGDDQGACRVD